jgi:3-hydroxyacyl-CoA dehydrogenase
MSTPAPENAREDQNRETHTRHEISITIIGSGTIGLSFAAFHLVNSTCRLNIYDIRPNLQDYLDQNLPGFFNGQDQPLDFSKIKLARTLQEAVADAHIVQESGPENLEVKRKLWEEVEKYAPTDALLWSSTSGIPASQQTQDMRDKTRLLVVHPYNPPHIMPLLELVPSPDTSAEVIERTQRFWQEKGRVPIHIKKETVGFVANRLAFVLFREAIHLVVDGVVSVSELDSIVESSMGPRWAVAGPFKSYHAGGGPAGLEGFFQNIGETVQSCWNDAGKLNVGDGWEEQIFRQAKDTYGNVNTGERDRITRRVLQVLEEEKARGFEE